MIIAAVLDVLKLAGYAIALIFGTFYLVQLTSRWHRDRIPCNSCKHLIRKGGGGTNKYACDSKKEFTYIADTFDRPPTYCRYYEPIAENKGREVEKK